MKTHLMTLPMLLMLAASVTLGQEAPAPAARHRRPSSSYESENFAVKIVRLENADADEVADIIGHSMRCGTGVDRRTNSVVITGPEANVARAVKVLGQLDQPIPDDNMQSALIRVGESEGVMDLLQTRITPRTRAGFNEETGMLALRGPADEIRGVHELVEELENQHRHRRENEAVRASFFFLRGSLEPEEEDEDTPPMPAILKPALEVLAENGFYNASLVVPLMVRAQSGEPFEVGGRILLEDHPIRIHVDGRLEVEAEEGMADLHVSSLITREVPQTGLMIGPAENVPLFTIESELNARIGDIIVLAASPVAGDGDMVALIVRLVPAG